MKTYTIFTSGGDLIREAEILQLPTCKLVPKISWLQLYSSGGEFLDTLDDTCRGVGYFAGEQLKLPYEKCLPLNWTTLSLDATTQTTFTFFNRIRYGRRMQQRRVFVFSPILSGFDTALRCNHAQQFLFLF